MLAHRQASGNCPVVNDALNNEQRGWAISGAILLRIFGKIPSGPGDLFEGSFLSIAAI